MKKFFLLLLIVFLLGFLFLSNKGFDFEKFFQNIQKDFLSSDEIASNTGDNQKENQNEDIDSQEENTGSEGGGTVKCGDSVCEATESDNCCSDCGCPAGKYCSDSGKCEINIPLKPIPHLPDFQIVDKNLSTADLLKLKNGLKDFGTINPNFSSTSTPASNKNEGIRISPSDYYAVNPPRIFGDKVVFSQYYKPGKLKGYIYDISSSKLEEISPDDSIPGANRMYGSIDIGSKGIVWSDNSSGMYEEGADIHYYNPNTGLHGYISPRNSYQVGPLISGNSIAWQESDEDSYGEIYIYWLPSGEERKVYSPKNQGNFSTFDLYYGKLAYSAFEYDSDSDKVISKVYIYDLGTDKTKSILRTGNKIDYIAIGAHYIVYSTSVGMFVYDLNSKLTNEAGEYTAKSGLSVYGDKFVYASQRSGKTNLYVYDIPSKQEKQITFTDGEESHPFIYQNIVAYVYNNREIRLLVLED